MTRHSLVCLLAWGLAFPPGLSAATAADAAAAQKVSAVFLALDAANARVTYRLVDSDTVTTSPVSSAATLQKLAKLRGGQKVILKCRAARDSEIVVEDVKKKTNWRKWGIILAVVTLGVLSFAATDSSGV